MIQAVPFFTFRSQDFLNNVYDDIKQNINELIENNNYCWGLGQYAKSDNIWTSYPIQSSILTNEKFDGLLTLTKNVVQHCSISLSINSENTNIIIDESFIFHTQESLLTQYQTDRYSHLSLFFFLNPGTIIVDNPLFNNDLSFTDQHNTYFKEKTVHNFDKNEFVCIPSNINYKYSISKNDTFIKMLIKYI